jgi:hypothetical protein
MATAAAATAIAAVATDAAVSSGPMHSLNEKLGHSLNEKLVVRRSGLCTMFLV